MGRFAALVAKLKAKGEPESEATGVAAIAGRKKYGKKRFVAMGAAGRRNHDVSMSALDMLNAELELSQFGRLGAKKSARGDVLLRAVAHAVPKVSEAQFKKALEINAPFRGRVAAAISHASQYKGEVTPRLLNPKIIYQGKAAKEGTGHVARRIVRRALQHDLYMKKNMPVQLAKVAATALAIGAGLAVVDHHIVKPMKRFVNKKLTGHEQGLYGIARDKIFGKKKTVEASLELGEENQHKKFKSEPFKTFRRRALKTAAVITGGPASPFSYSAHSAANHLEGEQNHKALRRTLKVGSFLSGGPLSYLLQRQAYKKHLQPVEASLELGALDIGAGLAGHAFRVAKSTYGKVANGFRKAAPVAKAYFNRATSQGRQAFQNAATGGRGPVIQRAMDATKAKQAARAAANAVPADQRPGINATRDFVGKSWAPHIKKAFGSVKGKVAGIGTLGAGAAIGAAAMGTRPQNPLQAEAQRRQRMGQ